MLISLIGLFLVKLKNQITPQLFIALDEITKTERLIPRRKKQFSTWRLLVAEVPTYHSILYRRLNIIGAESNAMEGLMVLDLFDTVQTILHSYDNTHPNAVI